MPAIEPPPTSWVFPAARAGGGEVVGVGADLEPGTILAAYRAGLFPMEVGGGVVGWWSPEPRGILPLGGFHASRTLRRARHDLEVRVDTAFGAVIRGCADPRRDGAWISADIVAAYTRLFELGWAHSVEAFSRDDDSLAGGVYGLAIGGLFCGESMFHRRTDAGKVALWALVELLGAGEAEGRLLDVQWRTPHLASLGVVEVSRAEYADRLGQALVLPPPAAFG